MTTAYPSECTFLEKSGHNLCWPQLQSGQNIRLGISTQLPEMLMLRVLVERWVNSEDFPTVVIIAAWSLKKIP